MSQKLLISDVVDSKNIYFDSHCTSKMSMPDVKTELINNWIMYKDGCYIGPLKITFDNKELFKKIEPVVKDVLKVTKYKYPEDIWGFYCGDNVIYHPSKKELDDFLAVNT